MGQAKKPRIITWDLEFSGLKADLAYLICGSWKVFGEKEIHSIISYKPWQDKKVAEGMKKVLMGADMIITWFGTYCDIPYLNSRLLANELSPLPPIPHIDGWWVAKKKLKLHSNRLDSVAQFLGLEQKVPVTTRQWAEAYKGNRAAIDYLKHRCEHDVKLTEQAYEKLRPLIQNHPSMAVLLGEQRCPVCGDKGPLQKRGFRITNVRRHQRYQCQKCGAWSQGRAERVKGVEIR